MTTLRKQLENTISVSSIRTDGGTQPRAALYQNVIDDYADALAEGASFPPVVVFYDGTDYWLADGFHRHGAHRKLGLTDIEADVRQGTRAAAKLYSAGANGKHGLQRTREDKRRAVDMILTDPEVMVDPRTCAPWSDREIARICDVSHEFVRQRRANLTVNVDSETRTYVDRHGNTSVMNTANIGRPAEPKEPVVLASSEPATVAIALEPANDNDEVHNHRAQGTGENEWYTPARYIELARSVIGEFDVDPASNPIAQKTVRAGVYYTEETNGLDKPWRGSVWCNPPYAQPAISYFADKMAEEVASGNVTAAIMLTHNYTDTAWFNKLARAASAICFTRGRIKFESPSGEKASPTQGQAFFYFGPNASAFRSTFDPEVGFVVEVK